jgi:hypothetical protein
MELGNSIIGSRMNCYGTCLCNQLTVIMFNFIFMSMFMSCVKWTIFFKRDELTMF